MIPLSVLYGPTLTAANRESLAGHRGGVVWFTGLSGSGKTTVARVVDRLLFDAGRRSFLLDGDALRTGLNEDLGFSPDDREANLRRFAEVSRLFAEAGMLCLVSAITPYEATRDRARERVGAERFILVHVATPLEVCEARDAKGLYRPRLLGRARSRSSPASSPPARSPATPTSCCVPRTGIRRRWAGEWSRRSKVAACSGADTVPT